MLKNRNLRIGLLLMMCIAVIVGSSSVNAAPDVSTPDKNTVLIKDYDFQPAEITIQRGETITWINQDSMGHTATGNTFDSGLLGKGQSFKQTFKEAGIFEYICTPHPFMKGKVIVQ